MTEPLQAFQRYLTPRSDSNKWGIRITDLGATRIPPDTPYPPFKHPESYTLNQETGRILEEYQVVLITRGRGLFWSEESGDAVIEEGTLFLLFPGIRHRYHPDPDTGWNEYWIGFSGYYVDEVVPAQFSTEHPVHKIAKLPEMQFLFKESCELAQHELPGFREQIGIRVLQILVALHLEIQDQSPTNSFYEQQVRKACTQMGDAIEKPFDSQVFARKNGISHTSFRRHFKSQMGISPIQYLLDLRIRKANHLLMQTSLPVSTIANECGFENPLYFSRLYKKRTGQSPSAARVC